MTPFFSIVVPTCNRLDDLDACLSHLASGVQTMSLPSYELIVTDDSRDNSTQRMIAERFPWARWTAGPAMGPAANRNHGATLAGAAWLIFIDDDCLAEPQLLEAYHRQVSAESQVPMLILEGRTVRVGEPKSLLWEAPHNPFGGACISANFAIRKIDFEQAGKFDERYPHAAFEDTEFFTRFHFSGGVTRFVNDATVHHPLRPLGNPTSLAKKWEGKVIYAFDQKASSWTVMWRLPWHVLRVVQSRFRQQQLTCDNLRAGLLFFCEWILVLYKTPSWVLKWSQRPRSKFWSKHVSQNGSADRYGF